MKCKIKLTWTNLSHQLGMLLQQFADRKHPQVTKACIHSMNSESSKWTCRTFSWIVFDINKIFLFRMWRKMYAKYVLQWIYVRITNDIWKTFIHSKCVVAYCTVDSSEKKRIIGCLRLDCSTIKWLYFLCILSLYHLIN